MVLNGVKEKSALFRELLTAINEKYNVFTEIRGEGLLIGAVVTEQFKGRAKDFSGWYCRRRYVFSCWR